MTFTNTGLSLLLLSVFGLCFARIHMRVETTLIGYKLGKLKQIEMKELEVRSELQMTLSKLNSKEHLEFISSVKNLKSAQKHLAMIGVENP